MAMPFLACFLILLRVGSGLVLRASNATIQVITNSTQAGMASFSTHAAGKGTTFRGFYDAHTVGRGIWKWQNALDAYQRHFGMLAGSSVAVGEVGVQSGGSLLMWQAALGSQLILYGLDINKACKAFAGPKVTIVIGDQADPAMWKAFFAYANTVRALDILVDDGGHESHQMLATLVGPFAQMQPGGFIAIEDIHGPHYLQSFFTPAAYFIGHQAAAGQVESVHLYPFLLIVKKAGQRADLPMSALQFGGNPIVVADFGGMWTAIKSNPGSQVILQNPGWGPFLTGPAITNFFSTFNGLHDSHFVDTPTGCNLTPAAECTNNISPLSDTQKLVTGVHVYSDRLVVEVAPSPPILHAVRRGTEWIGYGF
jgi:cephalosporin hydroxylase